QLTRAAVNNVFSNVAFSCFNYDRCIEVFLQYAIASYFGIAKNEAERITRGLEIVHPYGCVGSLPLYGNENAVGFGAVDAGASPDIARHIRTFTERVEESTTLDRLRDILNSADNVVFLGFGFHPMNMELLDLGKPENIN